MSLVGALKKALNLPLHLLPNQSLPKRKVSIFCNKNPIEYIQSVLPKLIIGSSKSKEAKPSEGPTLSSLFNLERKKVEVVEVSTSNFYPISRI